MSKDEALAKAVQVLEAAQDFSDEDPSYSEVIKAKIDLSDAWLRLRNSIQY